MAFKTEHAGGTIAGALLGRYAGKKLIQSDLQFRRHYGMTLPGKVFKAGIMLPTVAAGALIGLGAGKLLDKAFKK